MSSSPEYSPLKPKEVSIAELVAEGCKNKEIATSIGTTEYVIKNRLRAIYEKLGLWNRTELALWYVARTEGVNAA